MNNNNNTINNNNLWDASKERFEKEENIADLVNRIILWRLFYKTISLCVL